MTPTTRRCRCCDVWSPPVSSDGSPARASTTTDQASRLPERFGLERCRWDLPDPRERTRSGPVAVGADLDPSTLVAAYGRGLFPMPLTRRRIGWWSPDPRGILPVDRLRVTRSLRQSSRRYRTTVDHAFDRVIELCAGLERPNGWISSEIVGAYRRLARLGLAHSVETWSTDGDLIGGLYGVSLGGFFAGESMFHLAQDASKVALMALVDILGSVDPPALLDVQWTTPHLASLGAVDIDRDRYLLLLADAIDQPSPPWPKAGGLKPGGPG